MGSDELWYLGAGGLSFVRQNKAKIVLKIIRLHMSWRHVCRTYTDKEPQGALVHRVLASMFGLGSYGSVPWCMLALMAGRLGASCISTWAALVN